MPMNTAIDPLELRRVLGSYATGVTAITARSADGPIGMAANSFTSVSLDPPLVLFCAARSSATWPGIRGAGHFCVNILSEAQESLCAAMAAKGSDRFADVSYRAAATGAPVIAGALGWLDCSLEREVDGGDHVIVLGRVQAFGQEQGEPLLFFRGRYSGLR